MVLPLQQSESSGARNAFVALTVRHPVTPAAEWADRQQARDSKQETAISHMRSAVILLELLPVRAARAANEQRRSDSAAAFSQGCMHAEQGQSLTVLCLSSYHCASATGTKVATANLVGTEALVTVLRRRRDGTNKSAAGDRGAAAGTLAMEEQWGQTPPTCWGKATIGTRRKRTRGGQRAQNCSCKRQKTNKN